MVACVSVRPCWMFASILLFHCTFTFIWKYILPKLENREKILTSLVYGISVVFVPYCHTIREAIYFHTILYIEDIGFILLWSTADVWTYDLTIVIIFFIMEAFARIINCLHRYYYSNHIAILH